MTRPDPIALTVDVTEAAALGREAHTAVTVVLPSPSELPERPVVCFAFPGATYSRGYFTFDMPGSAGGGQAGWHAERGWIFVACDHLGVGDSTVPEGNALTFENVARANKATVEAVLEQLADGSLLPGYPPIDDAVVLGIGQSMGGGFTIIVQGQHHLFTGIGVLGFSAIHTVIPARPGAAAVPMPWISRAPGLEAPVVVNEAALLQAAADNPAVEAGENPLAWAFHFDDVPADIVAADMTMDTGGPIPPWRSMSIPPCVLLMVAPGALATEAAAIRVPLLLATGERDVVPDPSLEPKAYQSARDITVFVCPHMAHMHNFAGTRETFWRRIHSWGTGVAAGLGA